LPFEPLSLLASVRVIDAPVADARMDCENVLMLLASAAAADSSVSAPYS